MKTKIILFFIVALHTHVYCIMALSWKVRNYKKNESFNSSDLPKTTVVQLSGFYLYSDGNWYSANGTFCIGVLSYDNEDEKQHMLNPAKDKIVYTQNQEFILLTADENGSYADTGLFASVYLNYTGQRYSKRGSFTNV